MKRRELIKSFIGIPFIPYLKFDKIDEYDKLKLDIGYVIRNNISNYRNLLIDKITKIIKNNFDIVKCDVYNSDYKFINLTYYLSNTTIIHIYIDGNYYVIKIYEGNVC